MYRLPSRYILIQSNPPPRPSPPTSDHPKCPSLVVAKIFTCSLSIYLVLHPLLRPVSRFVLACSSKQYGSRVISSLEGSYVFRSYMGAILLLLGRI